MTMEAVLTELTDEFIQSTILQARIRGAHTDGGDAWLPPEHRGAVEHWDVVERTGPISVTDVYPALEVCDLNDPQETVLSALAIAAEDRWRNWVASQHPDWDHRGYEDVRFTATIERRSSV